MVQPGSTLTVMVDKAFGPQASQEEVFQSVKSLASDFLAGISCGVLTYGQTGSGKLEFKREDLHNVRPSDPPKRVLTVKSSRSTFWPCSQTNE